MFSVRKFCLVPTGLAYVLAFQILSLRIYARREHNLA